MDLQSLLDLALIFIAYYLIERLIRYVLQAHFRVFFDHLIAAEKLSALTAFCLGLCITLFSTPICAHAYIFANADKLAEPSWEVKTCITSRVVLLVAELNRLDYDILYVIHHIGSLLAIWVTIKLHMPINVLVVTIASLVAEIPGDTIWILSAYAASFKSPPLELNRIRRALAKLNVIQYAILRTAGFAVSAWLLATDTHFLHHATWEHFLAWILMLAHAAFYICYIARQSKTVFFPTTPTKSFLTINILHKPPHIRFHTSSFCLGPDVILTLYGIFMGLGFSLLSTVVLLLVPNPSTRLVLPIIQLSAICGARIASLVFEDGMSTFFHSPISTFLRPGFWLHGGIVGAVIGICYCHTRDMIDDLWRFAGAMGVGLPIFETASRVGCHFYGCCFGRPLSSVEIKQSRNSWLLFQPVIYPISSRMSSTHAGKALFPIQLYSALLFLLVFFGAIPLTWYMSTPFAGFITLASHAAIRLHTETYRADYRGPISWSLSVTGKFAVAQMVIGLVGAGIFSGSVDEQSASLPMHHILDAEALRVIWVAFGVGFALYGVHRGEIGKWVVESDVKEM